jgi:2-oxoisovalerate dehydrogenase E1 component alpha subunit
MNPVRFSSSTTCVKDNMLMTPNGPLVTTKDLCVVDTTQGARWPVFRLLNSTGQLVEGVPEPKDINEELAVKMYSSMVQIQVLDEIMNLAQRQGRISFYMQAAGEEAIHIGALA